MYKLLGIYIAITDVQSAGDKSRLYILSIGAVNVKYINKSKYLFPPQGHMCLGTCLIQIQTVIFCLSILF